MRASWRVYGCLHVADAHALVCSVDYDYDSGAITATCAESHGEDFPVKVLAWGWLLEQDPSLAPVDEDLTPGSWHWRSAPGQPWVVEHPAAEASAVAAPSPVPGVCDPRVTPK